MKRVTRAYVNRRMRHELFNGIVVPGLTEGEKIIVRQNRKLGEGRFLVNGDIGTVIHRSKEKKDTITVKFTEDEHTFRFSDEELQQNYGDGIPVYPRQPYNVRIDYGYAVTVHASQGSEWGKVLLCDDGMWAWREEQRRKLLYTAVTRAKQKLVVFDARG